MEDMKVYIRERLNGYYLPVTFTIANTLASLPFIFLISVVSTVCVYFIAGLSSSGGDVIYFILALFASLTVVESLMMAIAPVRMLSTFFLNLFGAQPSALVNKRIIISENECRRSFQTF